MSRVDVSSLSAEQQKNLLAQLLKKQVQLSRSFPMSAGQKGLWHAYRRDPQSTAFNVFLPTRFRGPLRVDVLEQLINLVVKRHASLRTTFSDEGGKLIQTVHDQLAPEFNHVPMFGADIETVRDRVLNDVLRPFDLERGPLMRMSLYQVAEQDWVVLALTHHIVVDFWSLIIILDELRQAYPSLVGGREPDLPQVTDNYREFVLEQQKLLQQNTGNRLVRYWRELLEGVPPVLEIPTDRIRPAAFTHRADSVSISIEPRLSEGLANFASAQRATPFAVVHAALQVLLSRYSHQESFFIGSPFSGRSNEKYEQTVGFFINMLPIKASVVSEKSFDELIRWTTIQLFDTLEHELYPIAEIVRLASIPRDPSRSPLFQVSCTFEKAHKRQELGRAGFLFPESVKTIDFAGTLQESFYVPHPTCHYDLEFVFEHSGDGLNGMLIYCKDLFSRESMQQMAKNFSGLLESLLVHRKLPIGEVPWNLPEPAHPNGKLSADQNHVANLNLGIPGPQKVHEMIVAAVIKYPDSAALRWSEGETTYQQLLKDASSLSKQLVEHKVQPGTLVPVVCSHGWQAFVAMLAVHLAGGAAIPIDSTQPTVDLMDVLKATCPQCYVGDACGPLQVVETNGTAEFPKPTRPAESRDTAYMIYTSGSTGTPKGVLVGHAAICNTLRWRSKDLTLDSTDRVLMLLSHQFDAALGIGWSTLAQGATLVWPEPAAKHDPTLLLQQMIRDQITVLPIVPSQLRVLASHPLFSKCTSLRSIWTGGEPLPPDLPILVRSKLAARIWNLYGPTEAAVEATAFDATNQLPQMKMSIGRPIDGVDVLVVDSLRRPVPSGVPGELAIAGAGLANGYFGDEELTRRRFVPHANDPHRRMYLTGDLARQLPNGSIEFLGRLDHQVKLRGFRIELGEIESVLQSHPSVQQAAVIVQEAETPNARLIAFVSPAKGQSIDTEQLRLYLSARLSHAKRPSALVVLDSLPVTSSGKVDRNRLPTQVIRESWPDHSVPPRNAFEERLAEVWCKELGLISVGVNHNFFEVGGSSLQAAMVTTNLSTELGQHVPTALLFDLASIAQVAQRLVELYPETIAKRFGESAVAFYAESARGDRSAGGSNHPLLAPLKPTGTKPPIFMVHPPGGIVVCYRELAQSLESDQPLWAIRSRGLHGKERLPESIEEMASEYIEAIRTVQPEGPYMLGGWSLGGLVAYEMAKQLNQRESEKFGTSNRDPDLMHRLIFLDTTIKEGAADCVPIEEQVNVGLEYGIDLTLEQLGDLLPEEQLTLLRDHTMQLGILHEQSSPEVVARILSDLQYLFHHHLDLSKRYRLDPIEARLLLLRPLEVPFELNVTEDRGWRHLVNDVIVRFVPGHHHSMVQSPNAQEMTEVMMRELNAGFGLS